MPPLLTKAATVILLKENHPEGFEVFLLKRHEKSSFMGGNYVYPGGRIDREDRSHEIFSLCQGVSKGESPVALGNALSSEESLAIWIGGIRELFEEAGILLAYTEKGHILELNLPGIKARFSSYRKQILQGQLTLCQLAHRENLRLALDQVRYYAHWITPEARPQRFDTYFFVARHPEGQEAFYDEKEMTAGLWITPKNALRENLYGEVILSPPTLKTLEDLARFKTIDDVFYDLKNRNLHPILPILTFDSKETFILFPWDPDYERFQRGKIEGPFDHGKPTAPAENTTRVVFKNDRWQPYSKQG